MQLFKSFYKFIKFNISCIITRFCYIFFGAQTKIVVFTAVLVPCLLQFSLIAFGQNGVNIIDSSLDIVEVNRKHIKSREIIVDVSNLIGKNRFVFNNMRTQGIYSISFDGQNMTETIQSPSNNKSRKESNNSTIKPSFFHRQFVDPFHYEPADSILYWAFVIFMHMLALVWSFRDNDPNQPRVYESAEFGRLCAVLLQRELIAQ